MKEQKIFWNRKVKGKVLIAGILCLFCVLVFNFIYRTMGAKASEYAAEERRLQNGGFEDDQNWTSSYVQITEDKVPGWNTTAFQGKIELFKENTGVYIKEVKLTPSEGEIAAELNADEESTLYQNVKTTPSSVYEWGLDHGGRNGTDTMALVIGPKQDVNPSKPSKDGRDQLMQMIDWLIEQGETSVKTSSGLGEQMTVYSKKFSENGTFADNEGNNAFSMTPSMIYSEEWHIWIISDCKTMENENSWGSYGSNAESAAGSENEEGNLNLDLSKYYLYTVPAGQTETLFGFVSVGVHDTIATAGKEKTYGNFLDNVNFQLYLPLSASSTSHGSALVGDTEEGQTSSNQEVHSNKSMTTYVTDGKSLKIQAVIKKEDAENGCEFVGVYYTKQDTEGNSESVLLAKKDNEIEDTGELTDEQKQGKWIKSTNDNGDITYTYYLDPIFSATDLHFIFIKSPTITYDSNGGKPYIVDRVYNTSEEENVYSFKPVTDEENPFVFIDPYISHEAEGQNDGWKFIGWMLTGDENNNESNTESDRIILPGEHTIACDYSIENASQEHSSQYFKIYDGNVALTADPDVTTHVTWNTDQEDIIYGNYHKGLTMIAQWRWLQAFLPQIEEDGNFVNSSQGGSITINVKSEDENYYDDYNDKGGKSYHAAANEMVEVKATAKEGYTFLGWYDEEDNLLTTNPTYCYTEIQEKVNTFYARFSGTVTQNFIRQIERDGKWTDIDDDQIGTLGRYTYTDTVGTLVSSTAKPGTGYAFVGWYDEEDNKVDMTTNEGMTISYITTKDATYYARFEIAYTVSFAVQTKQEDGSFTFDDTGGSVSIPSVTGVNSTETEVSASPNTGYVFQGWYDEEGKLITEDRKYAITITPEKDGETYYARFEVESMDISVRKVWKDGQSTFRPDSITVQLLQDGVMIRENGIDALSDWQTEFAKLDKYHHDGITEYLYEVREKPVSGYIASVSKEENVFVITNVLSHTLTIHKTVASDMGDKTKQFQFEIYLEGQDTVSYKKNEEEGVLTLTNGAGTFTLSHDESIILSDIPLETQYRIQELNAESYDVECDDLQGTIESDKTVEIINRKDGLVPTSADTDSSILGEIIILGICAFVLKILNVIKRRIVY